MKIVYRTNEWKGYGKHNYYWNEYRLEDGRVVKYKCHIFKHFDGEENEWVTKESYEAEWSGNDPNMPAWIHKYI